MLGYVHRRAPTTFLASLLALGVALAACGDTPAVQTRTGPATLEGDGAGGRTASGPQAAPAQRRGHKLTRIGRFDAPVHVTQAPGDRSRLFVVEQEGRIRVVRNGRTVRTPFLDISDRVRSGGEQGLLSVAFAPDYASSGRFYVDYTDRDGDTRIVEFRRGSSPDRADRGSARQLLFQAQPESNHNGGLVTFGPDGHLYIGFGDGGGAFDQHGRIGNAQNLGTWLGKVLRIDPLPSGGRPYGIPADNPFVGRAGAKPEIYWWGLRNPWRFSFDRRTGDVAIADVGQEAREEVDFLRRGTGAGANFGWRAWEGTVRSDDGLTVRDHVRPVLEYSHAGGNCSITGGYVVRDRRLPALRGRYIYADFCAGRLLSARLRLPRARDRRALGLRVPSVTSFGEDLAGRVYVVSQQGPVYRLDPR
ncbi:PQQ-dependent sugar dehydrogenase [Conexibacter arvalis]|uniref:Glucose/arabinose dehydrogenase n=1 Tax=Conexibacter arvalis TaxID=912552 RepID=A0A840IEU9_9ACTN|nr:PQQ-dependent sugar dehydrogenase [Conexibacter arvalis]MBB4662751.1 glucose/arabinose dehydrogenase [Conexibacter arvalis]